MMEHLTEEEALKKLDEINNSSWPGVTATRRLVSRLARQSAPVSDQLNNDPIDIYDGNTMTPNDRATKAEAEVAEQKKEIEQLKEEIREEASNAQEWVEKHRILEQRIQTLRDLLAEVVSEPDEAWTDEFTQELRDALKTDGGIVMALMTGTVNAYEMHTLHEALKAWGGELKYTSPPFKDVIERYPVCFSVMFEVPGDKVEIVYKHAERIFLNTPKTDHYQAEGSWE